jgi:CubicO group peptidase (beta-lactamase class C family)
MSRVRVIGSGLGLLLFGVPVEAQSVAGHPRVVQAVELARLWLDAQRDFEQIPGLSAAVVHDQEVVWIGGVGQADPVAAIPATAGTIYSVCSISKLFTSIGVMQLRDAGKLRLDDPVRKHLPWFTLRSTAPEAGEVTIEGMLTHSSGLPRESDHPYWTGPEFPFPTREQIIERLSGQETLYPADTYFQYSNLGMALLGEVVGAASGVSYADYVRRNILDPLGLSSTTSEMPAAERGKRLAQGHGFRTREGRRQPMPFFQVRGIAPAAGYASTAEDLARFASWQFRVLARKSSEVLSANSLREMHRVHWVDPDLETMRGLGFDVWRDGTRRFVGHDGWCPGFRTKLQLQPEDRIATVFMANAMVNSNAYAGRLYDIVAPAILAAVKDSGRSGPGYPDLSAYTGLYGGRSTSEENAIAAWEDGLASVEFPTMDPVGEGTLTRLRPAGTHTFRRVRKDGTLGEAVVFEVGPDGRATRLQWHGNYATRLR